MFFFVRENIRKYKNTFHAVLCEHLFFVKMFVKQNSFAPDVDCNSTQQTMINAGKFIKQEEKKNL